MEKKKTNSIIITIFFGLLILIQSNAFASEKIEGCLFSDGCDLVNNRTKRIELAKVLKNKIDTLDRYLPSPKPSDTDWVNKEQTAIKVLSKDDQKAFIKRTLQLRKTAEYQNVHLKEELKEVQKNFIFILKSEIKKSSEMVAWAFVSQKISDKEWKDSINILINNDKLPSDIKDKSDYEIYYFYSRGIIEYLLIPYLVEIQDNSN